MGKYIPINDLTATGEEYRGPFVYDPSRRKFRAGIQLEPKFLKRVEIFFPVCYVLGDNQIDRMLLFNKQNKNLV